MRVLIADADERLLRVLQNYLWDQGHDAEVAVNALECMVVLREFHPEVLVLERDLLWGGADGVLAVLAEQPLASQLPVILLGDSDRFTRTTCESLCHHVVGSLHKPFRLADLLGQIETIPMEGGFVLA